MMRMAMAAAVVAVSAVASIGVAKAVEVDVGPGGVYVEPGGHWHYYHRYARDCRTVIRHHINRFGESVTDRRRICD
jgi:hypothetical protein